MDKFIAFPVGQGDSFYLDRNDYKILVDGGRSKLALPLFVSNIARTDYINVVVCTHNDADHATGIIGLLENWEGQVEEVWIPGSWTYRLQDLFVNSFEFCSEIVQDICRQQKSISGESNSEIDIDILKNKYQEAFKLEDIIEDNNELYLDYFFLCFEFNIFGCEAFPVVYGKEKINQIWEYIQAAKRIRKIAELAYHRGCNIRFFEFDSTAAGGKGNILEPVNSREICKLQKANISAFDYLRLTIENKQSLVFYAPESKSTPGVLFTADSDLEFSLPFKFPSIPPLVTAPHHGSIDNKCAYAMVNSWLPNDIHPIWVRSDCKNKKRPCSEYREQRYKFCTLCNNSQRGKDKIEFVVRNKKWCSQTQNRQCVCV